MKYEKIHLKKSLNVSAIISVHYFEYTKDFMFPGEAHDFWELLYVDKGEVIVTAGSEEHTLKQGQMILHPPHEFHSVKANGETAPNLIVTAFDCSCKRLYDASHIIFCSNEQRDYLSMMLSHAKKAFCSDMSDPHLYRLQRAERQPFGCEQLIKIYLELLLIKIINGASEAPRSDKSISPAPRLRAEEIMYGNICDYLTQNIRRSVSVDEICRCFSISSAALKQLFRSRAGCGAVRYHHTMKIEQAKKYIREDSMNITEISEALGFSSLHYFSRYFKIITGMSPTQYSLSVRANKKFE